ncbi:hypothetical protein F2Q70_00007046 [Brassica cretica]|uniref:RRM domain-containing protein n=1 Tax=Brassica cretica TaxID=69181 RepID=A0A8S9M7E5_BRACR|nr:hypothetical protein F2Q70_00007046 [Brassica cretica]
MPRYEDRHGSTRLYVGHLSSRTRTRDVERLFSKYGRIRDVDMKRDFAFVDFSDPRDADDARSMEVMEEEEEGPMQIGSLPDFAEVYNFIGSVFDPDSKGRMKKLKEMDPINFETVLLLMRNLTVNMSNPDFEPS